MAIKLSIVGLFLVDDVNRICFPGDQVLLSQASVSAVLLSFECHCSHLIKATFKGVNAA